MQREQGLFAFSWVCLDFFSPFLSSSFPFLHQEAFGLVPLVFFSASGSGGSLDVLRAETCREGACWKVEGVG